MAARDPQHPRPARARDLPEVQGVDLSGGTSTVGRDRGELTVGRPSVAKAYAAGFAPDPRSPAGHAQTPALLVAYARHQERLRQMQKAADVPPQEIEQRALKKGIEKAGRKLAKGKARDSAYAAGYLRYRESGGRLGISAWLRKATNP
jgi:hypothetical protein